MSRLYFGTDGVRGIFGVELTSELVERIGKAATLWSGGGRVLVGRDTRGSGPELEQAVARGIASAGGTAVLGGVLPTPAVAFLAADELGVVISASHNPPEYNGVKLFHHGGKLVDEQEEEIEALFDADGPGGGSAEQLMDADASYLAHVVEAFGSDLSGLRVGVDCANGAFSAARAARVRAARCGGARDRHRARRLEHQRRLWRNRPPRSAGARYERGTRPRRGVRRRRRSHARGRRARRCRRRRPDPRGSRTPSRRRPGRGDRDDEPRLPQAHGRPRREGRRRPRSEIATSSRR